MVPWTGFSFIIPSSPPTCELKTQGPFSNTGVDYAGPIILKDSFGKSPKTHKAYIAVFVCLCTKAVHLEIVSSLTQEAFLSAFRRFVNRRGCPLSIKSDNGTTFKGANRELQDLFKFLQEQRIRTGITNFLSNQGIRWSFIPPAAPHQGGLWEAAVKSAKFHINRVMNKTPWNFEETRFDTSEAKSPEPMAATTVAEAAHLEEMEG
ncbi:unnamed protein product [Allacma fusca]|uniref:Integrase catalytic domain-containing protein n=1 Tax=Allacma fusca TaxID=39272 RepID=A0A8J2KTC5_9HEXA|nr:unnamed protein product [Allacma fusca]